MRHDFLYLNDIVEAAAHIAEFIRDKDYRNFEESELLRSAVIQKLTVIGEAAGRVSDGLRLRHPDVPLPSETFWCMRISERRDRMARSNQSLPGPAVTDCRHN